MVFKNKPGEAEEPSRQKTKSYHSFPWWTFRIFCFLLEEGKGESRATGGGGRFLIENPRRGGGGGSHGGRGGEWAGRVFAGNWGAKFFFGGRNARQVSKSYMLILRFCRADSG